MEGLVTIPALLMTPLALEFTDPIKINHVKPVLKKYQVSVTSLFLFTLLAFNFNFVWHFHIGWHFTKSKTILFKT